ncbi:MAG: glycosyltransferase [Oscillospiraceae bacterium]|nr:glycosyltransferase [Oscillospiraceae bacterium]
MSKLTKAITESPLQPIASLAFIIISRLEYIFFNSLYAISGDKKPSQEEINFVKQNVTFMYKSFERQKMAKRLYKSTQSYYPGAKVVIADDSKIPLELDDENVEIIHLPFNSGISVGLNRALERIKTPYLVKLDDDGLLTRRTKIGEQLNFLVDHPKVDLVAFCSLNAVKCKNPDRAMEEEYNKFSMKEVPRKLLVPHLTEIDDTHVVMGKTPNYYVARTDSIRKVGWDDNIRMIDHHEFFWRAIGILVSVVAKGTVVFHYHNIFNRKYQSYRLDIDSDLAYIRVKRMLEYEELNKTKETEVTAS